MTQAVTQPGPISDIKAETKPGLPARAVLSYLNTGSAMTDSTITIVVIAIAAMALLGWLWWQVPKWQLNRLKPKIPPR
jgi:hypothetical protein